MPIDRVRGILEMYPDAKFGFMVYRCTYDNEENWNRFMEFLNAQAKGTLVEEEAEDLFDRLDWNLQEDQSLDGATMKEVHTRFRDWIDQGSELNIASPRHSACVMVEKQHVDSVIEYLDGGEALDEFDMFGVTYVKLISDQEEEDNDNAESPDEKVPHCEVGISYLIPRVYMLLDSLGWESVATDGIATP